MSAQCGRKLNEIEILWTVPSSTKSLTFDLDDITEMGLSARDMERTELGGSESVNPIPERMAFAMDFRTP